MSPRLIAIGFAALAAALPATASAGLLRGNHPKVQEGTDAYDKGDYPKALEAYEAAQKLMPKSAELLYNLGDVYMKLGRADDAKRAYEAALANADDGLKARDYYNLGNALVGLERKDEAINAYRQALKVDPKFEPARRNLEVLLRQKTPPKQDKPQPGDGGTPPDGGQDAGSDAGSDGGRSDQKDAGQDGGAGDGGSPDASSQDGGGDAGADGGGGDGGRGDGGGQDGGSDGGADGGGQSQQQAQADGGSPDAGSPDGGTMSPEPQPTSTEPEEIDKQEAERLLDAVRRNEKQFLMQQKQKGKARAHPDKDW